MMRKSLLLCSTLTLLGACSWDRFQQLRTDPPVFTFTTPAGSKAGFGTAVATARLGNTSMVLVTSGTSGAPGSLYTVGTAEKPTPDAYDDSNHCVSSPESKLCAVVEQPAALPRAGGPSNVERELCFVSGVGHAGSAVGLWTRCLDHSEYAYPLPDDVEDAFIGPVDEHQRIPSLRLATDSSEAPILLAGAGSEARAWFYPSLEAEPFDLIPEGTAPADFGTSIALALGESGAVAAVGSPASGAVWFFRITGQTVETLGCLSGATGFGQTLAAGDFDGDGLEEVAIADAERVSVFDGAALSGLVASADEACVADLLPSVAEVTCEQTDDVKGCANSSFGQSLVLADLDGDGKDELAVGAPRLTVREIEEAGAVQVFGQEGELVATSYALPLKGGDLFGRALGRAAQEASAESARDVLIVGSPGFQQTHVVFCATVEGSGISPRCE